MDVVSRAKQEARAEGWGEGGEKYVVAIHSCGGVVNELISA